MKFNRLILRIASFWTAFALSVIVASLFFDATRCTSSHTPTNNENSSIRSTKKPVSFVSNEDYAVYSAVMEQRLSARKTYVVGDTAFDELRSAEEFPQIDDEVLNDYFSKTKESNRIESFKLKSRLPVVLLSDEEEDEFFSKSAANWNKFYEKYPGSSGIIHFSNVGYSRDKTEAVVRVKYLCELCNGKESFYFLTKSDNNWRGIWRVKQ